MNTQPHTWPRLYVEAALREGIALPLSADHTHYLVNVLRVREGNPIRIFNGRDGEWRATLDHLPQKRKETAILTLHEQRLPQTPEPDIWLCCAPIKRAHFDFMVQKATELGASVIQPVLTARTVVRDTNTDRLATIAIEAAEQSERMSVPIIREAVTLDVLMKKWPHERLAIICAEHGEAKTVDEAFYLPLATTNACAAIFTGPEGGLTHEELLTLQTPPKNIFLRLGRRILRADTAALAALSCWQAFCGDWKHNENDTTLRRDR